MIFYHLFPVLLSCQRIPRTATEFLIEYPPTQHTIQPPQSQINSKNPTNAPTRRPTGPTGPNSPTNPSHSTPPAAEGQSQCTSRSFPRKWDSRIKQHRRRRSQSFALFALHFDLHRSHSFAPNTLTSPLSSPAPVRKVRHVRKVRPTCPRPSRGQVH
jgi:hypothetical protein